MNAGSEGTGAAVFDAQLERCASIVEKALDEALPPETHYPRTLHRAMRYSALGGGKRLRAFLTITSCEAVGAAPEQAIPVAAAIEMVHAYSLVHDDLPSMDDDDFRRGKPTNHKVFGEAVALLAGDALLTRAVETLAHLPKVGVPADAALHIIAEIASAGGSDGMIGGQVIDFLSEGRAPGAGAGERLAYVHAKKTGALFSASARAGALAGGATAEQLEALTAFATDVGLAFQIVDDLLDETGDPSKLGKETGRDRDRNKLTYPAVYGLAEAQEEARRRAARAEQALYGVTTLDDAAVASLAALTDFVVERTR